MMLYQMVVQPFVEFGFMRRALVACLALGIGSGLNQETVAPDAAVTAIVKDTSIAYEAAFKAYLDGTIPNEVIRMGAAQGVVYIGEYYIDVPAEVKAQLEDIYAKLAAGEITITLE